jgi:hypothetical protein
VLSHRHLEHDFSHYIETHCAHLLDVVGQLFQVDARAGLSRYALMLYRRMQSWAVASRQGAQI